MPLESASNLKNGISWAVSYGGASLGWIDSADPGIELLTKEIQVGSMGEEVLGEWILRVKAEPTIQFREICATLAAALVPWYSGSGPIPVAPEPGTDLYDYAKELRFHPSNVVAGDTTYDIVFPKAVCRTPFTPKRDGVSKDMLEAKFSTYPVRTLFPRLVRAYVGASVPTAV